MQSLIFVIFFSMSGATMNVNGNAFLPIDSSENAQPATLKKAEIHQPTLRRIVNFSRNNESLKDSLTQNIIANNLEILKKQLQSEEESLQDKASQTKNNEKKRHNKRYSINSDEHSWECFNDQSDNPNDSESSIELEDVLGHASNRGFSSASSSQFTRQLRKQSGIQFNNFNHEGGTILFQGLTQHINGDIINAPKLVNYGTHIPEQRRIINSKSSTAHSNTCVGSQCGSESSIQSKDLSSHASSHVSSSVSSSQSTGHLSNEYGTQSSNQSSNSNGYAQGTLFQAKIQHNYGDIINAPQLVNYGTHIPKQRRIINSKFSTGHSNTCVGSQCGSESSIQSNDLSSHASSHVSSSVSSRVSSSVSSSVSSKVSSSVSSSEFTNGNVHNYVQHGIHANPIDRHTPCRYNNCD